MGRCRFIKWATTGLLHWPFIFLTEWRLTNQLRKESWRFLNTGFINCTADSVRIPVVSCNSTAGKFTAANRVVSRSGRTSRLKPESVTSSRFPASRVFRRGSGWRRPTCSVTETLRPWSGGRESSPGCSMPKANGRFATTSTFRRRGWRRTERVHP